MVATALGDFLRSRRAAASTAATTAHQSRRRVAGLRREEVAVAAAVSVDYYSRLEQGRETSPSAQVVQALSVALRLPPDAREHLFRLAGLAPRWKHEAVDEIDPALLRMLGVSTSQPALLLNRAYDVIASNSLGEALFGGFGFSRNLAEKVFLDPAAHSFYCAWSRAADSTVAGLRYNAGRWERDGRLDHLVVELQATSEEFSRRWLENNAEGKIAEVKRFMHPVVGPLEVRMLTFDVRSSPGQELVVYDAEPGSPSARALDLLADLRCTGG